MLAARCHSPKALLLALVLAGGCRSEQVAFQFSRQSVRAEIVEQGNLTAPNRLKKEIPLTRGQTETRPSASTKYLLRKPRATHPNKSRVTTQKNMTCALMEVDSDNTVVISQSFAIHPANLRRHSSGAPPALNSGNASFLLAAVAIVLGVGGVLLISFSGGWLGITLGVLAILVGAYLGLWAGLLGEFPSKEPFRFSKLFKIK